MEITTFYINNVDYVSFVYYLTGFAIGWFSSW